jgi:hypothetical protein
MNKDLEWTGERLVTDVEGVLGVAEHLHRYALACEFVKGKKVLDIASGEGYGSNIETTSGKELKKKINLLEKRFDHIIFYMNNDEPGIKFNMQLARTYRKHYIQNPIGSPKDVSDYVEHYNVRRTKQMLQKQISHLFNVNKNDYAFFFA